MNKPRRRTFKCKGKRHLKGSDGAYQVRSLSFVSCLINAGAVVGLERLPHSAYFLWNDDFEYTTTLLKNGVGYYVPQSVVVHKTKVFGSSDADPGARFYNEVRNKIWMMRFSRSSFTRAEYIEFVLKTARRWLLTLQHGDDRDLLRDCFKRGWHDGWHSEPRSNEQIFADMPKIAYDIAAVENILGKAFANDAQ